METRFCVKPLVWAVWTAHGQILAFRGRVTMTDRHDPSEPAMGFPYGGSAAAGLIRERPWADGPLGPMEEWPQSLKSAVDLALDSPLAMIVLWGPELVQIYNDAFVITCGDKHPQGFGQAHEAVWPEVWEFNQPIFDAVWRGETRSFTGQALTINRGAGPEEAWFDVAYSPLRDETGAVAGALVVVVETTGRVLADARLTDHAAELERRVAERTAEYARVWTNSRDILVIAGSDGVFRAVSPAWTTILGHEASDVVGRSFRDFVCEDDTEDTAQAVEAAAAGVDVKGFENLYRHQDGSLHRLTWRTSEEGGLIYGYARDVTEQRAQAEELRGVAENLRQSQKMEAVGQLTGGIAHDFNNMLTGVIGGLDMIERRLADGRHEDVARFLAIARQSGERAATLTKRLLAFSRLQSLELKVLDVNQLALGMEDMLRRTLGGNVELKLTLEPDVWPVEADPSQLESALLNLTINARDAMPKGGALTIETSNVSTEDFARRHPDLKPGEYVRICVADQGAGMSQKTLDHAFEPFFTTKAIGQGTGLGLSMIYGFAKQSHGHVALVSKIGEGTTVKLWLPRIMGAMDEVQAPVFVEPQRAPANATVLLVEDEAAVRMLITEVLSELGCVCVEAISADTALPILRSKQRIDLLVTDVGLPGMNGRQLAEMARTLRPGLQVLFVTGYAEGAAHRGEFLGEGMEMIAKPFAIGALAEKISIMLGARPGINVP